MIWKTLRAIIFLLDAEVTHLFCLRMIRVFGFCGGLPLRVFCGSPLFSERLGPGSGVNVFGMTFRSPVGLAAGFDKNGEIITAVPHLGFGFLELGTVTPSPQPGNRHPRLFRAVEQDSVFNLMGFNNIGASLVSMRLEKARKNLPQNFRIGVNIGKNLSTPNNRAHLDYVECVKHFKNLADYIVINVSSPNTPMLRNLQKPEELMPLVTEVANHLAHWNKSPPLLLKLSPELKEDEELINILIEAPNWGITGWVLTNTLAGNFKFQNDQYSGGWSGKILTQMSRKQLIIARKHTAMPIISVGGIMNENEALERFSLGANLIQVFTGWIYDGPRFPRRIMKAMACRADSRN